MNTPFSQSFIVFTILWHGSRKQQSNTKGNESKGETNTRKVFEHFHACLIIPTHIRTKKGSPSGEAVVGCVCTNKKLPSRRPPTNHPSIAFSQTQSLWSGSAGSVVDDRPESETNSIEHTHTLTANPKWPWLVSVIHAFVYNTGNQPTSPWFQSHSAQPSNTHTQQTSPA